MAADKPYAVGIDPGLKGAVVALTREGRLHTYWDMPVCSPTRGRKMRQVDAHAFKHIVAQAQRAGAQTWAIEAPQFIGMAPFSQASLNRQFGLLLGVVIGRGADVRAVAPRTWRRGLVEGKKPTKAQIMAQAAERWPNLPLKSSSRARSNNMDGRAEAAFLALHALRVSGKDVT